MHRVRFIHHRGQRVLLIDYAHLQDENEMLEMIEVRKRIVSRQAPGSLLTLTDVTGATFTKTALEQIKAAAVLDRPFVRRAAMVGVDTLPKGLLEAVSTFALREWEKFDSRQEALEWLIAEDAQQASEPAKAG
jgi:hypothetical protein